MIVENLSYWAIPYLILYIATHAFTLYCGCYYYSSFHISIHTYIHCRVDNQPVFTYLERTYTDREQTNSTQNGLWIQSKTLLLHAVRRQC